MKRVIAIIILGIMFCANAFACAPNMPQGNPKFKNVPEGTPGSDEQPAEPEPSTPSGTEQTPAQPNTPPVPPTPPGDDSGE